MPQTADFSGQLQQSNASRVALAVGGRFVCGGNSKRFGGACTAALGSAT